MTFNLNLYGGSPAELRALINALADLPGGLTIEHTPSTPHPAQPQSEADPAVLDKIRDLARSLIVQGKRDGVQQAIKSAGAAAISKLPPESYTAVWEQLLKLKDEVDADAAG